MTSGRESEKMYCIVLSIMLQDYAICTQISASSYDYMFEISQHSVLTVSAKLVQPLTHRGIYIFCLSLCKYKFTEERFYKLSSVLWCVIFTLLNFITIDIALCIIIYFLSGVIGTHYKEGYQILYLQREVGMNSKNAT